VEKVPAAAAETGRIALPENLATPCKGRRQIFYCLFGPSSAKILCLGSLMDNPMQIAMLQDKIVALDELEAVYLDRGMFFGDGVYEVLRSYDGKIFALEEHLARFKRGLAELQIGGIEPDEVRRRVQKAFATAGIANARIYFHLTRGSAIRNHLWDDEIKPNFFLMVTKLREDRQEKTNGIAVSTYPDLRWKRCDIKSLNLLANVLARKDASRKGCGEAILLNEQGFITEGAASAFFAIAGGGIQTASLAANILPSITRKFVFEAAGKVGLELVEKPLTPRQAIGADELFIAVTTKDIVPVVRFDDNVVGDGRPGRYTKLLMEQFRTFTLY